MVSPQLVAFYATYQRHESSPLILKPPQETYIIISTSLMRILCDPERLCNVYKSTVSLPFISCLYMLCLFIKIISTLCSRISFFAIVPYLSGIQELVFAIIAFSKQLFALIIKQYFVLTVFSYFNNSRPFKLSIMSIINFISDTYCQSEYQV